MRVAIDQIEFLKQIVESLLTGASVYLFGSRVFDDLKGGDIDVLVVGNRPLTTQEKRTIKIAFHKEFGEQKIDIVSFRWDEPSAFKDLVIQEAIQI